MSMAGANNFAFVKFHQDKITTTVPTSHIKKFDPLNLNKKYKVKYPLDGLYYKAWVLQVGGSMEEVNEFVKTGTRRLTHPPWDLMESCTETTGLSEDENEEDPRENILKTSQRKSKSIKKVVIDNELLLDEIKVNYHSNNSDENNEKLYIQQLKNKISELKQENLQLKNKNAMLKNLNEGLQKKVIDDWNVISKQLKLIMEKPPIEKDEKDMPINIGVGFRTGDGQVHLGRNVFMNGNLFDAICFKSKNKDSVFVKNIASAVFGDQILMNSSVTGAKCNRLKTNDRKPQLCETKVMAIKDIFQHQLVQRAETPEQLLKKLGQVNYFLAQKIADLRRAVNKKSLKENIDEDVDSDHQAEAILNIDDEVRLAEEALQENE